MLTVAYCYARAGAECCKNWATARRELGAHAATYAAFLNHAFDRPGGRFRNFMSFDRRWLEDVGSEDCQGHALWALGLCVSQAGQGSFQMLAAQLFELALPVAAEFASPRALGPLH